MVDEIWVVSDNPLEDATLFNFDAIVQNLLDFIASVPASAPFNICISGKWGSGKTTLLRTLEKAIATLGDQKLRSNTTLIPLWFAPWKLTSEEEVRTAMVNLVIRHIESNARGLVGLKIDVDNKDLLRLVSERFLQIDPDEASNYYRWAGKTKGSFIEIEDLFRKIARAYLDEGRKRKFVVFVDDLDRCNPLRVVEVLETVKLFFDIPGFVFVFALDLDQIRKSIADSYKFFTPEDAEVYLEKIFQLTYSLPQKELENLVEYVSETLQQMGLRVFNDKLIRALVEVFGRNLRNLKLFLNTFSFKHHLIVETKMEVDNEILFKWLYLEESLPLSFDSALRRKSLGLVIAMEFLARGGIFYDKALHNRYVHNLTQGLFRYLSLVVYSVLPIQESDGMLDDKLLDPIEKDIVSSLRQDGNVLKCIEVLREGNSRLIDQDLQLLAYLTRQETIPLSLPEQEKVELENDAKYMSLPEKRAFISAQEWNKLGDTYKNKKLYSSAYYCYLLAIIIEPYNATYLTDVGQSYRHMGRFKTAKAFYKVAYRINPASTYLIENLAFLHDIYLGEETVGSVLYRYLLEIGGIGTSAPNNLAMNLSRAGQYEQALHYILMAYSRAPDNQAYRKAARDHAARLEITVKIDEWNEELQALMDKLKPPPLTDSEKAQIQTLVNGYPELTEIDELT